MMRKRHKTRPGVHSNSYRKLRVEPLESRRLLAGDACNSPTDLIDDTASFELASQSLPQIAGNFQAADAAGGSLATAANLGPVEGTIRRAGSLSRFDRIDIARFEAADDSAVRVALDRLNRDADLYVLDRAGKLLASSTRSGTRLESLSGPLAAGEYYLAIVAMSHRNLSYRLTLDVRPLDAQPASPPASPPASQPPVQTPVQTPEPSSPPSPPVSTTPTTAQPLQEVAYFGGNQDWNINAVAAPEAWAAGYRGQGVTVAVIDTGVDLDHPDLTRNLYVNPGEIAGNGIDDDRNGYVDDVSGYDFASGDARPDDGNGHGTHVAGTIAASKNGVGATGVAPDAKILPVRVLDDAGRGSDANVAAGIRYAAELGAQIINLSLGGSASSRIASAIAYATSLGSLVVAAAGNESASTPSYPARHSAGSTSVLSVGAYDSGHRIAGFSNAVGGSGAVQVDAPGAGVYSTSLGGGYRSLSGTSMASPHVAGVAALTLSANPNLTSSELRQLLAGGTIGSASGSDSLGRISAMNSVAFAAAGLTTATRAADSASLTTSNSTSQVRATRDRATPTPSPIPSDFLAGHSRVFAEDFDTAFSESDRLLDGKNQPLTKKLLAFDTAARSGEPFTSDASRRNDELFASGDKPDSPLAFDPGVDGVSEQRLRFAS